MIALSLGTLLEAGAEAAEDGGDDRAEDDEDQADQDHPEPNL